MKKRNLLLACLTLVIALSGFHVATFTALADDPQGTGDTSKHPPCYPRCRPLSDAPTSNSNVPNTPASANADTDAPAVLSDTAGVTVTETIITALVQLWPLL